MKERKERVDLLLVRQGLALSREKAQRLIMAGKVYREEVKILKPSEAYPEDTVFLVRGEQHSFASRGGHKLQKAMEVFGNIAPGRVCMDVGAAAGGFTDVLLQHGARHVYAIDVGYGQMDWALRNHPQVTVMERTNARHLTLDSVPLGPTLTVMDVSFISIRLLLPVLSGLMGETGEFYTLIKPQFEAGKDAVGKNGVVRDSRTHARVLREIRDFCPTVGLVMQQLTFSPIKGPKGNIEFLAHIRPLRAGESIESPLTDDALLALAEEARRSLKSEGEDGAE